MSSTVQVQGTKRLRLDVGGDEEDGRVETTVCDVRDESVKSFEYGRMIES